VSRSRHPDCSHGRGCRACGDDSKVRREREEATLDAVPEALAERDERACDSDVHWTCADDCGCSECCSDREIADLKIAGVTFTSAPTSEPDEASCYTEGPDRAIRATLRCDGAERSVEWTDTSLRDALGMP
jgi:hypothetical protein